MALNDRGVPAVSFTGSQSGIITNDAHANARIVEVRPFRVEDELARGKVVIVAGYQGVSYKREVTTLGRGGSDTTAVALAAALGAEACEIYSDVDGVYSADPRVVPAARRLAEISLRGDAGAGGGGGPGPERAGGGVREGARDRDLRARHRGSGRGDRGPPVPSARRRAAWWGWRRRRASCVLTSSSARPDELLRPPRSSSTSASAPGKQLRYEVPRGALPRALPREPPRLPRPAARASPPVPRRRRARRPGCRLRDRRRDQRTLREREGVPAPPRPRGPPRPRPHDLALPGQPPPERSAARLLDASRRARP